MTVWYPCSLNEFIETEKKFYNDGNALVLLTKEHLGDEEEPMDLFVWGHSESRIPVLRSAITINKELFWRTHE